MIYDKLDNFERYAGLFPGVWQEVKDFFSAGVIPESGRYDLLPDGKLYVNVQKYAPHLYDEEKVEYHRDYIDIQLLLLGKERIIYTPIDGLEEVIPYSAEKDYGMDRMAEEKGTSLDMKVGNFAVFFPGEGHEPCIGDPDTEVVKAVVKIRVN